MGYRKIADSEMVPGQPVTADLLAQIRDNLPAICAGEAVDDFPVDTNAFASGALNAGTKIAPGTIPGGTRLGGGAVKQANLGSNSVGFNNLRIGTNLVLATSGAIATGAVTSSACLYILGWLGSCALGSTQYQAGPGAGETALNAAQNWLTNTSLQNHFWVYERSGVVGAVAQITWTYVAASPPYELAGYDVPIFVYLVQRPDGSIRSLMASLDPPWAPGPPTEYRDGRPWVQRRRMLDFRGLGEANGRRALLGRVRAPDSADFEEFELTPEGKNRDMGLHPHPFPDVQTGERVVLVDPVGDIAHDLAELHRGGLAGQIIASGDIRLGDEFTLPEQPEGVALVRASWR